MEAASGSKAILNFFPMPVCNKFKSNQIPVGILLSRHNADSYKRNGVIIFENFTKSLILYNEMTNKKLYIVETIPKSIGSYLCNLKNILVLAITYTLVLKVVCF